MICGAGVRRTPPQFQSRELRSRAGRELSPLFGTLSGSGGTSAWLISGAATAPVSRTGRTRSRSTGSRIRGSSTAAGRGTARIRTLTVTRGRVRSLTSSARIAALSAAWRIVWRIRIRRVICVRWRLISLL